MIFLRAKHKNFSKGNSFAYKPKYKFFLFLKKLIMKYQVSKESKPDSINRKPAKKFIPYTYPMSGKNIANALQTSNNL